VKKFLNIFFVTLGVIFFVIILISVYLFVTDPWNLKPLFMSNTDSLTSEADPTAVGSQGTSVDKHPLMNAKQEAAAESLGINPAAVPTEITPEQEACFVNALGQTRVNAIMAGDSPTATDFFKASGCL